MKIPNWILQSEDFDLTYIIKIAQTEILSTRSDISIYGEKTIYSGVQACEKI